LLPTEVYYANVLSDYSLGLNTIYCDEDIEVGDTVVVDIPCPDTIECAKLRYDGIATRCDFGFLITQRKRGIPADKITLVVRAMPSDFDLRTAFVNRGQVLGTCVTGGSKGKRIDIVHTSSAIGIVNTKDMLLRT
jgi:hypothetical protein